MTYESPFKEYIDETEDALRMLREADAAFSRLNVEPAIPRETYELCKRLLRLVDEGKVTVKE